MADPDELLRQFTEWLESSELAPVTIKSHRAQIKGFLRYCNRYRSLSGLNSAASRRELAVRYLSYERTNRHASESSIRSTHASLNKLWQFLGVECVKLDWEEVPDQPSHTLTGKERRRYIKAARKYPTPRDSSMALLMLLLGIGNTECVNLKTSDLKLDGKHSLIKTRNLGWMSLPHEARRPLTEWLALRHSLAKTNPVYKKEKWLFPVQSGNRMSTSEVHSRVAKIGRSCGVTVNARILQETHAARLLKDVGKNPLAVSCRNDPSTHKRVSPQQRELMLRLIKGGASVRRVAKIFGLHWGSLYRRLRSAGKTA